MNISEGIRIIESSALKLFLILQETLSLISVHSSPRKKPFVKCNKLTVFLGNKLVLTALVIKLMHDLCDKIHTSEEAFLKCQYMICA